MQEFGIEAPLKIKGDAIAAMGMVKRQGLGRVRHLAVADLWIQQKAKDGSAKYEKLPGGAKHFRYYDEGCGSRSAGATYEGTWL